MANPPPPVTVAEAYLAAIHDRLGELLDRLPAKAPQPAEGIVELREPAPPSQEPAASQVEVAEPAPPAVKAGPVASRRTRKPAARKGS